MRAEKFAVATANPLATKAACDVLAKGGTAAGVVVAAVIFGFSLYRINALLARRQ